MELVEFETLSLAEWVTLIRPDPAPFAGLDMRQKDHHLGLRDDAGRLLAVIGATVVEVTVEGHEPFEVVGVGGLIVRKDVRSLGLGGRLMKRMREVTAELGPDRAMLFCEPHLLSAYSRRGYTQLTDVVWVDQPAGPIIMPAQAMWRPLRPTQWPPGTIHVHGLPF